jgi:S1/P1 nuclease
MTTMSHAPGVGRNRDAGAVLRAVHRRSYDHRMFQTIRALVVSLTLLGALSLSGRALAWHSSGHMQIALLAYDQLDAPTQRRLVALLRKHPRFQADFVPNMPAGVQSEAERARWIFAFAATWPDVARNQPEYHHGSWHWINFPLALEGGKLSSCSEARKAFPASVQRVHALLAERAAKDPAGRPAPPAPPADAPAKDSLLDALARMRERLHDAKAPPAERALALSWVLHLVADAHQPLHAVALYTQRLFDTGDRGGNEIDAGERGSLHALWDGVLGGDEPFVTVEQKAAQLKADGVLVRAGEHARKDLTPARWLEEDCELARSFVYVPAVLSAVQRFEAEGRPGKPEVILPQSYVDIATATSRERAAQAAARLAAWLAAPR